MMLTVLVALLIITISSCRSTRKMLKAPMKEYGENYLLERMKEAQLNFEWFSSRFNITITNNRGSNTEMRGQLRIRRDSAIWISLTPMMNIEAARLLITPDSVKFINRLDKTYYNDDYAQISNLFSSTADYYLLQALLLGNDLVNYETDNFKAVIDKREYRLNSTGRTKKKRYLRKNEQQQVLIQSIWLNPENFKISRINLKEVGEENHKLVANYRAFENYGSNTMPTQIEFELNAIEQMKIRLQYLRPELDVPQSMPFRIPENFSKMK